MTIQFEDIEGHLPKTNYHAYLGDTRYSFPQGVVRSIQRDAFKVFKSKCSSKLADEAIERVKNDQTLRAECVKDLEVEVTKKLKKDPEVLEKIKKEVQSKIEKAISDEIRAELKKDPKLRKELRKEVLAEILEESPSLQERSNFVSLLHDKEVECLASGEELMKEALSLKNGLGYRESFNTLWTAFVTIATTLVIGYMGSKVYTSAFGPPNENIWGIFIVLSVVFAWIVYFQRERFMFDITKRQNDIDQKTRCATQYLNLADEAKHHRLMTAASAKSKAQFDDIINTIYSKKSNVDNYIHLHPDDLAKSKELVRDRMMNEQDPLKILRIEDLDFETRLAEAQEAARQAEIDAEEAAKGCVK